MRAVKTPHDLLAEVLGRLVQEEFARNVSDVARALGGGFFGIPVANGCKGVVNDLLGVLVLGGDYLLVFRVTQATLGIALLFFSVVSKCYVGLESR